MGVNADGRRKLLGLKVGDSETEAFWAEFISHLKERGLAGVKLVISDAHSGLAKPIRRELQGCIWQRCRVHFARNLLQCVPKAHQGMVTAAMRSVFAQETAAEMESRWDNLAASLAERFPKAAALMHEAKEDMVAFRHFPKDHWRKIWSTNLFERVNEESKPRTRVVGIIPNDAAITRLVGAVLLEKHEHRQLEERRKSLPKAWRRSRNWATPLPCRLSSPERGKAQAPRGIDHPSQKHISDRRKDLTSQSSRLIVALGFAPASTE
jgi:putative transposase